MASSDSISATSTSTFHWLPNRNEAHDIGCSCNKNNGHLPETIATTTAFGIDCSQAPTDVVVEITPVSGNPGLYICTQTASPSLLSLGLHVNAANKAQASSTHTVLGVPVSLPSVQSGDLISGASGPLAVFLLFAIGSTIYYWRKYHQALDANRSSSRTNKPKVQ